jgi:hypothetical protein
MADINFGILDTQMPGRIAAIPQQQQAQQAQNAMQLMQVQQSMNQNELAKYQLSSAKRADTEAEQLRLLYGGASATGMADPEFIRKVYAVNPTQGMALEKALADRAKSGLDVKNVTSQITERDLKVQQLRTEHAYESFSRLAAMPGGATNEAIDAAVADAVKNQGVEMQQGMQLGNQLKNLPLDKRAQVLGSLALKAEKRLELFAPKPTAVTTPSGGVSFVDTSGLSPTAGQTPAGFTNFAPGMTPYQAGQLGVSRGNLAATQARLTDEGILFGGAPAAAGAPVAAPVNAMATPPTAPVNAMILRPATPAVSPAVAPAATSGYSPKMLREMAAKGMQPDGKGGQTFIPGGEKDPTAMARLEAAKAEGTATGKDTVAAIKTLPNAIASSQKALANIDAMLGDARVVNNQIVATQGKGPHPGFSSAVGAGIGLRFIPGTPASDFQERFREVTSGAFLEAFESLRGGGSITEKEGEKATAAKTRMNLAQSEKEFVTAAREYQSIIRDGVKRAQSRLTKAQSTSALGNVVDFGDLK